MTQTTIHPILRQIVGRCHVADSNRQVIIYVVSRLKQGRRTFLSQPREDRRAMLRQVIAQHRRNTLEYMAVMGGHTS